MTDPLDGFEAVLSINVDRDTAWTNLVGATPPPGFAADLGADRRWLPGFEGEGDVLESDEGKRLRVRKATEPCAGTEIVVVLEDEGTGTRITVSQTGFGDVGGLRPWLASGWATIVADFAVALERGVQLRRHLGPWNDLGCLIEEGPTGVAVASPARPGSLAAAAGLEPGDLLVSIAGTPVANVPDLAVLVRGALAPGVEVDVVALRGAERHEGRGAIA